MVKYPQTMKHGKSIGLLIWFISLILLVGCGDTSTFDVQPNIVDKKIISEGVFQHYVIENGERNRIVVRKNQDLCMVHSIKINENGITALSLHVWDEKPSAEMSSNIGITERMFQAKLKNYVLFISHNSKKQYKEFPIWIDEIEWINNDTLQIVSRKNDEKILIKNPFKN